MENIWAFEPKFALEYLTRRENVAEADAQAFMAFFLEQKTEDAPGERILTIDGDTAFIEISGPLSKEGPDWFDRRYGYGGTGYDEIIAACEIIAADETIKNVKFLMHTPGGYIIGVDEAWQAISALTKAKNTEAVNKGMIASAGYWLASATGKITSTSPVNDTGSIGVIIVAVDYSKMDERYGIKEVYVVSENAPNKYADISTDEGIAILQERVNATERVFFQRISEGRGVSVEHIAKNFGRGAVMVAQDPDESMPDAISVGMIDGLIEGVGFAGASTQTPAPKAGLQTEGARMSLKDLMAEDPGIKAEVEAMVREAEERGLKNGRAEVQARIDKAKAFIGETSYPKAIQALAAKVISGESEPAALEGAVAVFDAQEEQRKEAEAKGESENTPDTPPGQPDPVAEDGSVETEADFQAALKRTRAARGMEV